MNTYTVKTHLDTTDVQAESFHTDGENNLCFLVDKNIIAMFKKDWWIEVAEKQPAKK